MKAYSKWMVLLVAVALLSVTALGLHLANAAMLHVSTLADTTANDGYCTLREALINTNDDAATWLDCAAGVGADVIYLPNLNGQIVLLSDLPAITDTDGLTLQGPGAAQLAINGNDQWRILNAQAGVPVVVRNLALVRAGGGFGSAISVENAALELWSSAVLSSTNTAVSVSGGSLTVVDSRFSGNSGSSGAAIRAVNAPTTLVDVSEFMFNQASGSGHALYQAGGSLTLNNSLFQQNGVVTTDGHGTVEYSGDMDIAVTGCDFVDNLTRQGGALHDAGGNGVVHIENSRFIGNVAGYAAGAIRSGGGRALDIRHSVFIENSALAGGDGGVIHSYAPITITASAFYSNTAELGGVIMTENDATGPITIFESLFQGNHATHSGGAIWFGRGLYVTNSTFYSNTAGYAGGALASLEGWGEVNNSTFDHNGGNNGAALYFGMGWSPPITLRNTIIANPLWGNNCYAYTGAYGDGGYNLQYPGTGCNPAIPEVNPLLDPAGPRRNGGPTASIALQPGSPAIDRAPGGGGFYCPATDQRGALRPVDGDGVGAADCDSGAFEYDGIPPTPTSPPFPTATPAPTATPTPVPVVAFSKVAEDVNGAPLLPGDTIRYTVRVTNTFGFTATGVTLSDAIPTDTTYLADSDTPEADADSDPLVWSNRDILPGMWTFTFDVTVNAAAGGRVIQNAACVVQPGVPERCTPPVTPPGADGGLVQPQLQMQKRALDVNDAPLLPGDTISYTILITNAHAVTVTGVTITDALPLHTTYVAASATPSVTSGPDPLVWSGVSIPPGVSRFSFAVTVNADAGGQEIVNRACVAQPGLPQNCTPDIMPPGGGEVTPALRMSKHALDVNGVPLLPGDILRYTLVVTNPHSLAVESVVISDALPPHTAYVVGSATPAADADADPLVWSGQSFAAGAARTYQFNVRVAATAGGQTIANAACLTQPGIPETCTAPVTPPGADGGTVLPVLLFSKTALDVNGALLLPGDILSYTLVVTNPHSLAVANVVISDVIPTYTTYVLDSDTPEADADMNPLVWSGQSFGASERRTYQFNVRVEATAGGQTIANAACLTQPGIPQTCTAPVTPPGADGGMVQPQLQMQKRAVDVNGAPLLPGDVIRYTLVVTNLHSLAVESVVISDALPLHTAYVAGSATPPADADVDPLVWSGQSFAAGAARTYQFDARVDATSGGQIIANAACLTQPGIPETCTAPVTPPGADGGTVLPVLLFSKTALDVNGGVLMEDDLIRYTLTVTNPHGVAVSGVVISDAIPAHTTYVADSDTPEADTDANPLVWSGQSFDPGSLMPLVKTYVFTVTVDAGALGQVIRNTGYLTQPGLPQISTPPVEPPNGGVVKTQVYLPLVLNDYPAP